LLTTGLLDLTGQPDALSGNRDANRALYLLAIGRLGWDERTRAYADKRKRDGRTKPEIIRCLKRYIAREVYPTLVQLTA
jgi:hypothetical protein